MFYTRHIRMLGELANRLSLHSCGRLITLQPDSEEQWPCELQCLSLACCAYDVTHPPDGDNARALSAKALPHLVLKHILGNPLTPELDGLPIRAQQSYLDARMASLNGQDFSSAIAPTLLAWVNHFCVDDDAPLPLELPPTLLAKVASYLPRNQGRSATTRH